MLFRRVSCCAVLAILCVALLKSDAAPPTTIPVEGLRQNTPRVHALSGARIVVAPGRVVEQGTVVVRDGVIEAVGNMKAPDDARVWNLEGKTIYAGLFDAYGETSLDANAAKSGSPYWNPLVSPQVAVVDLYKSDSGLNKQLRDQGVTARLCWATTASCWSSGPPKEESRP